MWPFKPAKTKEELVAETYRDLQDLVAYASMSHIPYRAYDIINPLIELYEEPVLAGASANQIEARKELRELIVQFVFHCESDGWIKHLAYTSAKAFLEKTK